MGSMCGRLGSTFALLACIAFTAACEPAKDSRQGSTQADSCAQQNAARQNGATQTNKSVWVELGTQSGPLPNATRSQPAHLLLAGGQAVLIDAGDGAAEQLAKAQVRLTDVQTIFISHLHFDHIGGLFAILGLRYQGGGPDVKPLTIYGPPGTKAVVDGLRAAMRPGGALLPLSMPDHCVVELKDGSSVAIGGIKIRVVSNSHFDLWRGWSTRPVALSYRFDMADRSIVYTGDTGPSANVERLARNADLLVSEIMDADAALARLKRERTDIPDFVFPLIGDHFTKEHLLADEVGLLAAHAGVHALVITHFGGATGQPEQIPRLTGEIAAHYGGPIRFANDLERF